MEMTYIADKTARGVALAFALLALPVQAGAADSSKALQTAAAILTVERDCKDVTMTDRFYHTWVQFRDTMKAYFVFESSYQPLIDKGVAKARHLIETQGCQATARHFAKELNVPRLFILGPEAGSN